VPGGVRFSYSVTPDLFRVVASVALPEYLAVWVEGDEEAGDFRWLHLWRYAGGSFVEVIRADVEIPDINDSALTASLQVIQSDPAETVGDGSLLWATPGTIWTYDPVADQLYTMATFGVPSVPIWNPADGWIYYLDNLSDSGDLQLRRVRADLTGDVEVSTAAIGALFEDGLFWLTDAAFYALGQQTSDPFEVRVIGRWPLDGSTPTSVELDAEYPIPAAPLRHGLPWAADAALWARTEAGVLRLARFDGPGTIADLWPDPWAEWEDPGGGAQPMLSLSLNPDRTEVVVYAALADGGSTRGIIRTDGGAESGGAPAVTVVSAHEGTFPDYLFAMD